MRMSLKIALAASAIAVATPSLATVTVTITDQTTGTPLNHKIDASSSNTDDNKVTVYGSDVGNTLSDVRFIGGNAFLTDEPTATTLGSLVASDLHITPGGGFAFVSDGDADGDNNLFAIIIDPDALFVDMKFALQLTGEGTFDVYYLLAGGSTFINTGTTFTTDNKGNTNYLVDVTGGAFDAIQIVSSGASIFELKQVSINEAVPEASTWAMMLLGFGAIGAALRRRRRRDATLMQIA